MGVTDAIFFYNGESGSAEIGVIKDDAYVTASTFNAGTFPTKFTHVVAIANSSGKVLFYNNISRGGLTGFLRPEML